MTDDAEKLASAIRATALAALVSGIVVVLVGLLVVGALAALLAGIGAVLGLLNLWVAGGALRRMPAVFIGTSLPRLALVTALVLGLALWLGPVAGWALAGLLVTHLVELVAVLRLGLRQAAR